MKNLKLENFGVQEMDAKEMEEKNGGILPIIALFIITHLAMGAMAIGAYNGYKAAAAR